MKKIFMVGYSTDKGGVEAYIVNLCSQLSKTEYEVIYDWPIMKIDGKTWIRPKNRHNYFAYQKFWKQFFRENHFDIIYYNTCDIVSIDIVKFAKKARIPVRIIHSHNTGNQLEIGKKLSIMHQIMEKNNKKDVKKYATHLLACSESAGDWMFVGHEYRLIHNGIDLNKYKYNEMSRQKLREKMGINDELLVGCIGRLDPQKNPLYSEKVAEYILKEDSTAKFVFIGDGELKQEVQNIAKEKKLEDRILFVGAVDNVHEWMSAMDCLVMPSLFEGLPFVLVEAQAAGLQCVVSSNVSTESNLTGLVQFVDLEAGEKVWGNKILSACNEVRKDTIQKLIDAGYSIENTASEITNIIESMEI